MKRLSPRPDLGHLKKQAKALLAEARAGDAAALERLRPLHLPAGTDLRLHHAQWCLAREHGFASWPQFQAFVQARRALAEDPARALLRWLCLVYAGDIAGGNHTARPALAQQLWAEGAVPRADASDPWLACAVGDPVRLREQLARDPAWVHRTGGPLQLPPLLAVAHSSLAQLPAFAPGLLACADLLLRAGADANQRVGSRWPPASLQAPDAARPLSALYGAAGVNHHAGITRLLLAAGADPNDGESLYHALGGLECTRLLLEAGARVPGTNALHRVLDLDDLPALQLLLAHGADPNEPLGGSAPGAAPLLWAVRRRRSLAHVQALVAAGADPAACTAEGTPAHIQALRYGLPEVAAYLRGVLGVAEVPTGERFVAACAQGDEAQARALLAAQPGLVADLTPAQQRLLPELAAQPGCGDAVRLMVQLGWPIDTPGGDWDGTALHHAIFRGDAALTRFLLSHGARWQARHGFEDNACGALAWGSINTPEPGGDWAGCAQALLDHGLPPAAPDALGSEAVWLDGRLMRFSDEVTDCLLEAAAPR